VIARLRMDLGLVGSFVRSGSGLRAVLVALCTALVSGLLLVALTVVLFAWTSSRGQEQVSNLVTDGGVRGGYVFALLLICVAPLALLRQVVRLGTATREQRLAALRLAGAAPGDVRRLGALEVGLPALAGGFLGYLVFGILGAVFGGASRSGSGYQLAESEVARQLRLVPTTVHPAWWQVLLIALAVGLLGALAGATTSRSLLISPLGVTRRAPGAAPKPWAVLLLVIAIVLFVLSIDSNGAAGDLYAFGFVGLLVLSLLALAPWVAYRVGRIVAGRASTVPVLIAGRRLTADARPAGRAAAAVGAIAVVAGGGGALLADLPSTTGGEGFGRVDPFYTVPVALGAMVLLAALLLVVFSMALHGVESLIDHKRSVASLAALGASARELERSQRWEVGLVAVPMAVIGVLIGSVPFLFLLGSSTRYAWIPLLVDVATVALVWMAVRASTRMTRSWLLRAAAPANLRTP
jgi:hypothetical protein